MRGEVRDLRAKFGGPGAASLKTGFRLISIRTAAVRKLIPDSATIAADGSSVDFAPTPFDSIPFSGRSSLYGRDDGRPRTLAQKRFLLLTLSNRRARKHGVFRVRHESAGAAVKVEPDLYAKYLHLLRVDTNRREF